MGQLVYPEFDVKLALNQETLRMPTGELLGRFASEVDDACKRNGVDPFSRYLDNRPVPDGFDGTKWELAEQLGPREDWYDSAAGAQHLVEVAKAVAATPELVHADAIAHELRDLASQMLEAASHGARFRLEVG